MAESSSSSSFYVLDEIKRMPPMDWPPPPPIWGGAAEEAFDLAGLHDIAPPSGCCEPSHFDADWDAAAAGPKYDICIAAMGQVLRTRPTMVDVRTPSSPMSLRGEISWAKVARAASEDDEEEEEWSRPTSTTIDSKLSDSEADAYSSNSSSYSGHDYSPASHRHSGLQELVQRREAFFARPTVVEEEVPVQQQQRRRWTRCAVVGKGMGREQQQPGTSSNNNNRRSVSSFFSPARVVGGLQAAKATIYRDRQGIVVRLVEERERVGVKAMGIVRRAWGAISHR